MTKCVQRIRDLFEYALYKFTLYLLTYLHESSNIWRWDSTPIENLKLKSYNIKQNNTIIQKCKTNASKIN